MIKVFKVLGFVILAVTIGFEGLMFFKAIKSKDIKLARIGLVSGQLKPCDEKPNCVCSINSKKDLKHYISPIKALTAEELRHTWQKLQDSLPTLNLQVVSKDNIGEGREEYLHCTHTSKLMGFVDDIEFHYQPHRLAIEVKSSSRVGYSDLGANRKRMEEIYDLLGIAP